VPEEIGKGIVFPLEEVVADAGTGFFQGQTLVRVIYEHARSSGAKLLVADRF
jgi:hypothetical protein